MMTDLQESHWGACEC